MEFLTQFVSEEIIHALGWTVLHSLWQAVGIALLLAVAMLALQKHTAYVRYTAAYVALVLTFALAIYTFLSQWRPSGESYPDDFTYLSIEGEHYTVTYRPWLENSFFQRFSDYFNEHMPLLVLVWLMGVAFFALRLLGGLAYIQQLKTTYTSPIAEKWQYMLEDLAAQLPVKRSVELLESALVKVPMVIGHFKPVILLPVGAVNGLSPAQVEAILAHELAHIARHDYLLHLFQSLIEIFFYFNPAVWWISAIIRAEREHCCDDVAVNLCGNQLTYAKALVALQEMSVATPNLAMTFAGPKNQLLKRIQRILNQPQNKSDIMEKLTATCLLLALLVGLSVSAARPYHSFMASPEALVEPSFDVAEDLSGITYTGYYNESTGDYYNNFDTIPGNRNGSFSYDDGEKRIEARIENNKIVQLKIDGEEIPASEISQYEEMVKAWMANVPEPPLPPSALPTPMSPAAAPLPPATPMPTPEVWDIRGPGKITKEKDKNGNTLISIENSDGSNAAIEIRKDGKVLMNGKELKEGEEAAIFGNAFWGDGFDEDAWREHEAQLAKAEADFARQQEAFRKQEVEFQQQEQQWREQEVEWRRQEERARRDAERNENITNSMVKALRQDGLIENDDYQVELMHNSMKINDQKQPEAVAKKYRDLYEKLTGTKMTSGIRLFFDEYGDSPVARAPREPQGFYFSSDNDNDGGAHTYVREAVGNDRIRKRLEKELQKDHLIKSAQNYSLEITNRSVKVNGKALSEDLTKKYIELYEQEADFNLRPTSRYSISRRAEE